jgi:hypothetical protein
LSNRLGVFRTETDPRTGAGLIAAIGQLAVDVVGQEDYVKTGTASTAWSLASAIFGGLFTGVAIQQFTTAGAGTYTPTSGMKYCLVISTGGGGGGGGADTNGAGGTVAAGGGGGAGGTCIEAFSAATIGASQAVNVGAAGTAGADTGGNGGNGGDTTFGALHTAAGGTGGVGSGTTTTSSEFQAGGSGGTGTGGTVNIAGGDGGSGVAGSCDGTTDLSISAGEALPGRRFGEGAGRLGSASTASQRTHRLLAPAVAREAPAASALSA